MKRKIICPKTGRGLLGLFAAGILALTGVMPVSAEEYQGSKEWAVSFDGSKMESNFKSAEMTEDILNIQPGDSITLQVKLTNISEKKADWYMTNEVLQTLEESNTAAEGGAYTYILTYHDPAGQETVLYSSETVGGEGTSGVTEGLHQATDGLESYFYLDRLLVGESAHISLYVGLDGETQGNAYQDTLARLKMNFAVEKVNDETITEYVEKTVNRTETIVLNNAAKTGDDAPLMLYSGLLLAAGLGLCLLVFISVRKERGEKGEKQA